LFGVCCCTATLGSSYGVGIDVPCLIVDCWASHPRKLVASGFEVPFDSGLGPCPVPWLVVVFVPHSV
jgi:hypothetical protein